MPAYRLCRVCRDFHDLADPWPVACYYETTRTVRTHGVISDTMQPLRHPVTGRITDSKSSFRRDTKATGCVEIGNDTSHMKPRAAAVKTTRKEVLHRLLADKSDKQVRAMVKQAIKETHV